MAAMRPFSTTTVWLVIRRSVSMGITVTFSNATGGGAWAAAGAATVIKERKSWRRFMVLLLGAY
jgi:hypothetical protein